MADISVGKYCSRSQGKYHLKTYFEYLIHGTKLFKHSIIHGLMEEYQAGAFLVITNLKIFKQR